MNEILIKSKKIPTKNFVAFSSSGKPSENKSLYNLSEEEQQMRDTGIITDIIID